MTESSREQPAARSVAGSVEGTSTASMGIADWGQMGLTALIYGSAFLWMAIALRSLSPGAIAFGRVLLGGAVLALLPSARCSIMRRDWVRVGLASFFGAAAPFMLILLAQERIPSAVAGMTVSILPIAAAIVAAIETRRWPRPARLAGLSVGLVGAGLLAAPSLAGSGAEAVGILLALAAMFTYALATSFMAPLQQTYGSLRVTMWLLLVSAVMLSPLGLAGFGQSRLELASLGALLVLGVVGTGLVWAVFVGLVGRVGVVRAGVTGYFIPIVALILGVVVLSDQVELIQIAGVGIALVGGYLVGRAPEKAVKPVEEVEEPVELAVHAETASAIQMCR